MSYSPSISANDAHADHAHDAHDDDVAQPAPVKREFREPTPRDDAREATAPVASGTPVGTLAGTPAPQPAAQLPTPEDAGPGTWFDKLEAFISRLSTRDNFWQRICSFVWLPLAFFSGIKMKALDEKTYAAYLPFRKFNRNWYNAMAGGALLGNAEIAGGMYVFGVVGEEYTVVCKHLEYKFLRPCLGPAVYKMTPVENIHDLLKSAKEFDITIDMHVEQQVSRPGERDKRVGRCAATFHVTHKTLHKLRAARRAKGATTR
jgi:acyl-coenzyme A thioesterase PaaI-like protein